MLSLQVPATNCFHACICFLSAAKVNIPEVFSSPFDKEQSLGLYVNVMATDVNTLAPGGLFSLCAVHSRLTATVVPNRQLLSSGVLGLFCSEEKD